MVGCDSLKVVILVRVQIPQHFDSLCSLSAGRLVPSEEKWAELVEARHMYFVYLLECKDGSLYTGITTDVERRFAEHKSGIGGHYTRSKEVVRVVYTEQYPNRSFALKREAQIKGWTRQKKLALIKK